MRLLFLIVTLVACDAQVGGRVEAQSVGPSGLRGVHTDGTTLEGSGTVANPVRLKAVATDDTLEGTGSAGDPLRAPWMNVGGHIFGDGSDGDVVINSDTDLTRDMLYMNLTIDGAALRPRGHRPLVLGVLTFVNGGYIHANGGHGGTPTAGSGAPGLANKCGGGLNGGAGGTTGAAVAAGTSTTAPRQCVPGNAAGGTSVTLTGAAGGTCRGGGGGRGTGANGANGGGANSIAAVQGDFADFIRATECAQRGTATPYNGGVGGGGGGGSAGGSGGGGGGGGGILVVFARTVVDNGCHADGCIQVRGGNGGDADPAGSGGGGGGGGGGASVFVLGTGSFPSINVSGGLGGARGGGASGDGGPGGDGVDVRFRIGD